jgi:hypothetical protein
MPGSVRFLSDVFLSRTVLLRAGLAIIPITRVFYFLRVLWRASA